MEHKTFGAQPISIEDRTVTGIASVLGNVDDGGDITHPGAFTKTLQESKSRVRHLWQHLTAEPPTAVINEIREIGKGELPTYLQSAPDVKGGLLVKRTYLDTPRGNEILAGIRAGAISEMSFGYDPIKKDLTNANGKSIRNLREVRLYETSDVQWGMNPLTRAAKGVLRDPANCPKADKGMAWDGPAEVAAAQVDDLKHMCAYVIDGEDDVKGGYKLPHHEHSGDYPVVWNGVKAAMGALMGARGGVDIPEAARRAVYAHLAKHYEEFGEQPPDYKFVELAQSVKDARILIAQGVDFKAGRMISAANAEKIRAVIDGIETSLEQLENLLSIAEPQSAEDTESDDAKALTDARGLLLKLAIAEREIGVGI